MDIYSIVSSFYFLIFSILGFNTGKIIMYEIYGCMFITGLICILDGIDIVKFNYNYIYNIPLSITIIQILNKVISEGIKRHYYKHNKRNQETSFMYKKYYIPVGILQLCTLLLCIFGILYEILYVSVVLIILIQLGQIITIIKLYPLSSEYYYTVRRMLLKSFIVSIVGCLGLSTIPYIDLLNNKSWYYVFQIFIGKPTAYVALSYTLYTNSQLVSLIRGKNMGRKTIVRGTENIYVVLYRGRENNDDFSID